MSPIAMNKKSHQLLDGFFMSGRLDSNQRPPGPKPGILTGLNYAPNVLEYIKCGEGEIRTLGTV